MNRLHQLLSRARSVLRDARTPRDLNNRTSAGLMGGVLVLFLALTLGSVTLGKQLMGRVGDAARSLHSLVAAADTTSWNAAALPSTTTLRNFPSHPANTFRPYMNPDGHLSAAANPSVLGEFHALLEQFSRRQSEDDNFTVRVIDRRSDEVLELYELTEQRKAFKRGTPLDWGTIDDQRRAATRRLVDKYEKAGVPLEDIIVRWGRANQIERAQERNAPYRAYEIQLAHYLGLSLLSTQIGTVETFNQDDLVSSAGAKSRYQMMPWILRRSGVNTYDLRTESGSTVTVEEAYHPLLTMEPAFLLLRGYVNAVGHEIPGLSAYHAGPGNIYMLYRNYFTESNYYQRESTVVDAYIWAVTKGYYTVSANSTFGPFSRGYVPSAYGALMAQNRTSLDLSETIRTVRVQLKPDATLSLRDLLTALDTTSQSLDWGPAASESTTYARFRALNKHFDLPAAPESGLPTAGNVQLVSKIKGKGVRFFLPPTAPTVLRQAGLDVLDPALTFRFNESTFAPPTDAQRTVWDERYDALVDDIKHFGFTPENRKRLLDLHKKFQELAEETPSRYRQRQLDIIDTHRRIWLSNPWDKLSELTMRATAQEKVPTQPPVDIPTRLPLTRIP